MAKILLIDEELWVVWLVQYLKGAGHEVVWATSVEQAYHAFGEEPAYDLVISDVLLAPPRNSPASRKYHNPEDEAQVMGYILYADMRDRTGWTKTVPMLFFTVFDQAHVESRGKNFGITLGRDVGFCSKRWTGPEIYAEIERFLKDNS